VTNPSVTQGTLGSSSGSLDSRQLVRMRVDQVGVWGLVGVERGQSVFFS